MLNLILLRIAHPGLLIRQLRERLDGAILTFDFNFFNYLFLSCQHPLLWRFVNSVSLSLFPIVHSGNGVTSISFVFISFQVYICLEQ